MDSAQPFPRIVITGLGVVSSLGLEVENFWANILAGRNGISRVTQFDTTDYPCKIGAEIVDFDAAKLMDPKEARRNDRYTHFGFIAAMKAVADAGLKPEAENSDRMGVITGSGIGGMHTYEQQLRILWERGPRKVSPFTIPSLITNMCSGLIAIKVGARGPNFAVVSACASSAHSIGEAFNTMRRGEADVMIAGGSEAAITPFSYASFCSMKAMSTRNDQPDRACRPFELDRDGFIMGEGAGIVILETLAHAQSRGAHIYCELVGYGASCDAFHITQPDPEGRGLSLAMNRALAVAGVRPDEIDYINAHGTSTTYNDKFETFAIKQVFGDHARKLMVSSTKSMTGHLLGAAGAVEALICAKALQTGEVPPTINYETPDPECDLDYVPNVKRSAPLRVVLSNNLGFGGQNASLVLRRFE
jgi:3-oxoacyl-[acyl-carrier-protein] synthase II